MQTLSQYINYLLKSKKLVLVILQVRLGLVDSDSSKVMMNVKIRWETEDSILSFPSPMQPHQKGTCWIQGWGEIEMCQRGKGNYFPLPLCKQSAHQWRISWHKSKGLATSERRR